MSTEEENPLNLFSPASEEDIDAEAEEEAESEISEKDSEALDLESKSTSSIKTRKQTEKITPSFYLDCLAGLAVAVGGGLCWAAMATLIHPFFITGGLLLAGIGAIGYVFNHGLFTTLSSAASSFVSEDGYNSEGSELMM